MEPSASDALDIFNAGVRAAQIPDLTGAFGRSGTGVLAIAGLEIPTEGLAQVVVVGAGKAARQLTGSVAAALRRAVPDACTVVGIDLVPERHPLDSVPSDPTEHARIEIEEIAVRPADANAPTARAVDATRRVLRLVRSLRSESLVVCAFTGGGSATLCAPAPGITLASKLEAVRLLTADGATIEQINTLRRHLSAVKGGRLAEAARGARAVASLLVSDVDGDLPEVIASGPAVPDPTSFADALALRETWPHAVRRHLEAGLRGEIPETPKRLPANVGWEVLRSPDDALAGAAERAAERGWRVEVLPRPTPTAMAACVAAHLDAVRAAVPGTAILSVGEAPLGLPASPPRGGRAGHLALALGLAVDADPRLRGCVTALVGATDGEDGTSGTSGALVDAAVLRRAGAAGRDPAQDLARCDSLSALAAGGGVIPRRATGTNVQDLRVVLVGGPATPETG